MCERISLRHLTFIGYMVQNVGLHCNFKYLYDIKFTGISSYIIYVCAKVDRKYIYIMFLF